MDLVTIHNSVIAPQIKGRYITNTHIEPLLESYKNKCDITVIGHSVLGKPIYKIKIGKGSRKVLAWSQMHGNEATTTKAILDFLSLLFNDAVLKDQSTNFLNDYELHIIPILNPDGATLYTRANANAIDLNRDAQELSQPESKVLAAQFKEVMPQLCLNLHDQRSIYGLDTGKPAIVSFLSPAADSDRSITPSRKVAMEHIERMTSRLQTHIPGCIGRYDDSFNSNCVGDTFAMAGVPTILFEAGHAPNDYQREKTRYYIFCALLELFHFLDVLPTNLPLKYQDIPENRKNYCDVLLKNAILEDEKKQNIAIQYVEVLEKGEISFKPSLHEYNSKLHGYTIIDVKGGKIDFDSKISIKKGQIFNKIQNFSEKVPISLQKS